MRKGSSYLQRAAGMRSTMAALVPVPSFARSAESAPAAPNGSTAASPHARFAIAPTSTTPAASQPRLFQPTTIAATDAASTGGSSGGPATDARKLQIGGSVRAANRLANGDVETSLITPSTGIASRKSAAHPPRATAARIPSPRRDRRAPSAPVQDGNHTIDTTSAANTARGESHRTPLDAIAHASAARSDAKPRTNVGADDADHAQHVVRPRPRSHEETTALAPQRLQPESSDADATRSDGSARVDDADQSLSRSPRRSAPSTDATDRAEREHEYETQPSSIAASPSAAPPGRDAVGAAENEPQRGIHIQSMDIHLLPPAAGTVVAPAAPATPLARGFRSTIGLRQG
jgi:hypothetical protein